MPDRSNQLHQLAQNIGKCRICVEQPTGTALPHEPRPVVRLSDKARLCVAGQAPGIRVHKSGVPFDDPSGDRLRDWMGLTREQFYDRDRLAIVPMGFCFPGFDAKGSDLPPRRECARIWHSRIFECMPQVELLLVVGGYAQSHHLHGMRGKTVTETVANWSAIYDQSGAPRMLPLPHPSWRNSGWIKRHPWFELVLLGFLRDKIRKLI